MLHKTLESPLDCKEITPVDLKRSQSWIFIGRTDAEAEAPILRPSDAKTWLIGKDPYAGKDWRQEKKGTTEDEMVRWHNQFNGHEFEQAPGVGDGQGSLVCCSPWGCKELDRTEWLNWLNDLFCKVLDPFHISTKTAKVLWVFHILANSLSFHIFVVSLAILVGVEWYLIVALICISLMTNDEHFFVWFMDIQKASFTKILFKSFASFVEAVCLPITEL